MKKPMVFNPPFSYGFKKRLFFRLFYPVKNKWHGLFVRTPIKASPSVVLKLLPTDFMHGLIAFTGVYENNLTKHRRIPLVPTFHDRLHCCLKQIINQG